MMGLVDGLLRRLPWAMPTHDVGDDGTVGGWPLLLLSLVALHLMLVGVNCLAVVVAG